LRKLCQYFRRRKTFDWRQKEIKNSSRFFVFTLLFFLLIGSFLYGGNYVSAQTDQTSSKLQTANTAVEQAFNSVLDAEKAGTNVTQLLTKLNAAGELLADAENDYNSGINVENVTFMAENATKIAQQVNLDALNLRDNSLLESQNRIQYTVLFSIVGAIVFVIFLFLIWRRFKRSHLIKVLGMRPEVVENAT
jgi:CHASE3 domain sensor protein